MLLRMFGTSGDGVHDRMLNFVTPVDGAYYFAPSEELLEAVKEQDWCYSSEEHELGVHALAVPIYGPKGNIVAALNIVSPTARSTKEYLIQQILPLLQETARELRNVI